MFHTDSARHVMLRSILGIPHAYSSREHYDSGTKQMPST